MPTQQNEPHFRFRGSSTACKGGRFLPLSSTRRELNLERRLRNTGRSCETVPSMMETSAESPFRPSELLKQDEHPALLQTARPLQSTDHDDIMAGVAETDSLPNRSTECGAQVDKDGRYAQKYHVGNEGLRIDRYVLIRPLGQGGMGSVYLAKDRKLKRLVALKFLNDSVSNDRVNCIQEARITARCSHENIVAVHDFSVYGQRPYIVMEYLEGQTLRACITNSRIPLSQTVATMLPVAQALLHAHRHSVIHRDLKPENIFIKDTGHIKVMDFGMAKLLPAQARCGALDADEKALCSAPVMGTPCYMSPEQWRAEEADVQTDIWAFGLILFELRTGRHLFENFSYSELIRVGDIDRPLPSLAPHRQLLGPFFSLVAGCLRKAKAERISSAPELFCHLQRLSKQVGRVHPPHGEEENCTSLFRRGRGERW